MFHHRLALGRMDPCHVTSCNFIGRCCAPWESSAPALVARTLNVCPVHKTKLHTVRQQALGFKICGHSIQVQSQPSVCFQCMPRIEPHIQLRSGKSRGQQLHSWGIKPT